MGTKVRSKGDRVVDVGDEVHQVEQIRTRKHERVAAERDLDRLSPFHCLRAAGRLEGLQSRRQADQRIGR